MPYAASGLSPRVRGSPIPFCTPVKCGPTEVYPREYGAAL